MSQFHPPIVAGLTLDVIGWQVAQLFYRLNIDGFLLFTTGVRRVRQNTFSKNRGFFLPKSRTKKETHLIQKKKQEIQMKDSAKQILAGQSLTTYTLVSHRATRTNPRPEIGSR